MKKVTVVLFSVLLSVAAFAQKGKVNSAASYNDNNELSKALETINIALDPNNPKSEKSINWPKSWIVRGDIYQKIYASNNPEFKALSANPLEEAFNSYLRAIELDEANRYASSIKLQVQMLRNKFGNKARVAYDAQDYSASSKAFEMMIKLDNIDLIKADNPNYIDTSTIFNVGYTAYLAKEFDRAIDFYNEAAKYEFNGANIYSSIAYVYMEKGDTAQSIETLKSGIEKYPNDVNLLIQLVNSYLNEPEKGIEYLNRAIAQDESNEQFYFVKGVFLEKLKKLDEALESYQKAADLKADYPEPWYNMGIVWYNKGVEQLKIANAVPTNKPKEYEAEKAKADVFFKEALPFLEKSYEIKSDDTFTLTALKELYYRLQMMDKHAEIDAQLKAAQAQ